MYRVECMLKYACPIQEEDYLRKRRWGIDAGLAASIANGEDLGPIVRQAFKYGKPEVLLHNLKNIVKKKEIEVEELCKLHYEEFILAVDELRGVLVDADELKSTLSSENLRLQEVANSLLLKLDELLELYLIKKNVSEAIKTLKACLWYPIYALCAIKTCQRAGLPCVENFGLD
uniref:Exocyst complex component EXOC6/Sec15 N-terminal domain-containing protein n=1 Tax=Ananas comosus var. bracteatus TaxID=296719 RepID=A0A6V7QS06_ANACO